MFRSRTGTAAVGFFMVILLLFPGCGATMFWGTESVPVTSNPQGAKVFVDGKESGATPVSLRLPRRGPQSVIRIEYPGYDPLEIRAKRGIPTIAVTADVVLGAAIGGIIAIAKFMKNDETTEIGQIALISVPLCIAGILGADYALGGSITSPADLVVNLTKAQGGASGRGAPQVRTIFLDEDQFKNLKWIRVHLD